MKIRFSVHSQGKGMVLCVFFVLSDEKTYFCAQKHLYGFNQDRVRLDSEVG